MELDLWDEHETLKTKSRCEPDSIPKALVTT